MGTIDNLNFKLILDDAEFNNRVKADIDTAKELNTQLSRLLEAQKEYIKASKQIKGAGRSRSQDAETKALLQLSAATDRARRARELADEAEAKHTAALNRARESAARATQAEERLAEQRRRAQDSIARTNSLLNRQSNILSQLTSMASMYFGVYGMFNFAKQLATVTGEFETQRVALRSILKDADGADVIFSKLQALAIESPFTFQDLTSYAKQLAAFSIPINEIYDTTKMLADISAGLSVDMSRIILAYGQVRSASFLRGQEVRQFTEAGIPLLQNLAKEFEKVEGHVVTVGEVFDKISKRLVPFEMVDKVLKDLTAEGGQFFNMQSVLADTLKGKMEKLKDAYQQTLFAIGESHSGLLHGVLDNLLDLVRNYEELGRVLAEAVLVYGTYRTAVLVTTIAQKGFKQAVVDCLPVLTKLYRFMKANPYALAASTLVAFASVLYNLSKRTSDVEKVTNAAAKATEDFARNLDEETSLLRYLVGDLEKATVGTKDYDDAKKRLYASYGKYLTLQDEEALRVGNLTGLYDRLATSIQSAMEKRFYEQGMQSIQQQYSEGIGDVISKLNSSLDALSKVKDYDGLVTKGVRKELYDYVGGLKEYIDLSHEARRVMTGISLRSTNYLTFKSFYDISDLRKQNASLKDALNESSDMLKEKFAEYQSIIGQSGGDVSDELTNFQKDVNNALTAMRGDSAKQSKLWISENTVQFEQYVDGLRRMNKELNTNILNASTTGYQDDQVSEWKSQLEEVQSVAKLLGVELEEIKEKKKKKNDEDEDPYQKQRQALNAELSIVEKLKSAYEKLSEVMPKDQASELVKKLFPNVDSAIRDNVDYYNQIVDIASRMSKLGDKGVEKASEILARNGKDATDEFLKAFKAGEKFYDEMSKWMSKDFNLTGTGAVFDISKILAELNSANAKIDSEGKGLIEQFESAKGNELAIKALREKYGEEVWNNYLSKGKEVINQLMNKEREYNVKVAQEKINALADKYVEENLNIDLSGFSKMSLKSLNEAKEKIKEAQEEVKKNGIKLSDEQKKSMVKNGITTKQVIDDVIKLLNKGLQNLSDAELKKIGKAAQEAGKWIGLMGDGLVKLGNASLNDSLSRTGDALKSIGSTISSIGQGFATMGVWGAISAGIVSAFNEITSAIAENIEQSHAAGLALLEYTNAISLLELKMSETSSTIWGDNLVANISEAFSKSQLALDKYIDALDEINGLWDAAIASDDNPFKKATDGAASLEEKLAGIEVMMVRTKKVNWLGSLFNSDQYEALADLAPEIFAGGDINLDALDAFLKKYEKNLTDVQKEQLEYVKQLKEEYESLQKEIDDSIGSLVDSLASDLTSQLIENFKTAGNAVDDLKSSFESLGETILNSLLNSFIIDDILEEYTPLIKDLINNYAQEKLTVEDVALGLSEITDGIQNKLESSSDIINQMIAAFQDKGLLKNDTSESSSSTLSEGIKSITEDTASLLASYVNAIRADVSYGKVQRESIANDVKAILGLLPASPSLTEYLTQIQANTYNISVSTQNILTELQSVIAPYDGGGYAINVNN